MTVIMKENKFNEPYSLKGIDLEISSALLMKEWQKCYKRVFKVDFDFKSGDVEKIKEMVSIWGYDKTYISMMGAIRFYHEKWHSNQFKWLTVNQVYSWIGEKVWRMYQEKEFTVRITRPKI